MKNNDTDVKFGEIDVSGDMLISKEKEEYSKKEWDIICKLCGLDPSCTEVIAFDGKIKYFGRESKVDARYVIDGFLNTIFDVYSDRDYNRILKELVYGITEIIDETQFCPSAKRPMENQLFLLNKIKSALGIILGNNTNNADKFISMYNSLKESYDTNNTKEG